MQYIIYLVYNIYYIVKVANSNYSEKRLNITLRFGEWDLQKSFCLVIKPRLDSNFV